MEITKNDIELYLTEVKDSIQKGQYRIERNSRRLDNLNLFLDYVKLEDCYVIVVSLHEQKYPIKYYFKQ